MDSKGHSFGIHNNEVSSTNSWNAMLQENVDTSKASSIWRRVYLLTESAIQMLFIACCHTRQSALDQRAQSDYVLLGEAFLLPITACRKLEISSKEARVIMMRNAAGHFAYQSKRQI